MCLPLSLALCCGGEEGEGRGGGIYRWARRARAVAASRCWVLWARRDATRARARARGAAGFEAESAWFLLGLGDRWPTQWPVESGDTTTVVVSSVNV